jgi:hemoglobin
VRRRGKLAGSALGEKPWSQFLNLFEIPGTMKDDIRSREDITRLMEVFYDRLLADPSISYLFTDVAGIDMKQHIPVIVDFWESVLFQADTYHKNAMLPHMELHKKSPLLKSHFDTWLSHFQSAADDLFAGENVTRAKSRAHSVATLMQIKISQLG